MVHIKSCLYNYVLDDYPELKENYDGIVAVVQQAGFELDHRQESELRETHIEYDCLVVHSSGFGSGLETLFANTSLPILFVNGTRSKVDALAKYFGQKHNYGLFNPETIIKFLREHLISPIPSQTEQSI